MIQAGTKTQEWERIRKEIKPYFEAWGVVTCEIRFDRCWVNWGLGFAHPDKRRNLVGNDMYKVILGCNHCHHILEYELGKGQMRKFVENKIKERGVWFDGEKEVYL